MSSIEITDKGIGVVSEAAQALKRGLKAIEAIENKADAKHETVFKKGSKNQQDVVSGAKFNGDASQALIEWLKILDLDYSFAASNHGYTGSKATNLCFNCGVPEELPERKLSFCSKCHVSTYCSQKCQVADWKRVQRAGHKLSCAQYAKVGKNMVLSTSSDKRLAREKILSKIRFYAMPFAIHNRNILGIGAGFLFLQSNCTLAQLSLPNPIDSSGHRLLQARSVLLHYLTLGEYDRELCRDDFEMASVRTELKSVLETYKGDSQVVCLMRFRCGHLALGIVPLVPEFSLCKTLAKGYFSRTGTEPLQLNLDDI